MTTPRFVQAMWGNMVWARDNLAQHALTLSLGQDTCGFGNRHADHALIGGGCLKCGAAL